MRSREQMWESERGGIEKQVSTAQTEMDRIRSHWQSEITKKEQELGSGSSYQTLTAQRDLSLAELDLLSAMTIHEKAKVELDRATGTTLEHNGIQVQDAINGIVTAAGQ